MRCLPAWLDRSLKRRLPAAAPASCRPATLPKPSASGGILCVLISRVRNPLTSARPAGSSCRCRTVISSSLVSASQSDSFPTIPPQNIRIFWNFLKVPLPLENGYVAGVSMATNTPCACLGHLQCVWLSCIATPKRADGVATRALAWIGCSGAGRTLIADGPQDGPQLAVKNSRALLMSVTNIPYVNCVYSDSYGHKPHC